MHARADPAGLARLLAVVDLAQPVFRQIDHPEPLLDLATIGPSALEGSLLPPPTPTYPRPKRLRYHPPMSKRTSEPRSAPTAGSPALYLRSVDLRPGAAEREGFPFGLPLVQRFAPIELSTPVTFLVGENAAGKSTFLEALAVAVGSIAVGREELGRDGSLGPAQALARELKLTWNVKTHKGFFLRAEDFFGYLRRLQRLRAEHEAIARGFEGELSGYGLQLAKGAALGQAAEIDRRYGGDLDARSHGEGFLTLFQARFQPGGLYLLDEPEAALSPTSQLGLIAMIKQMIGLRAQFVVATHSPMLMAFPGARILSFDDHPVRELPYDEVGHVQLWRDFLRFPETFLNKL